MSGITVIRPVGHTCEVGGANDRCVIPPYGIFGGMPGLHGDNKVLRGNGEIVQINRAGGVMVGESDTLSFRAPGGGGYGDPLDRDLDNLQMDLDNELVSFESARRDYGAIVDRRSKQIDRKSTEANRKILKAKWKRNEVFIDQWTKPYAGEQFRVVGMKEKVV
jgi:N-methylhydantoinase B